MPICTAIPSRQLLPDVELALFGVDKPHQIVLEGRAALMVAEADLVALIKEVEGVDKGVEVDLIVDRVDQRSVTAGGLTVICAPPVCSRSMD
jgi:hypothetical protein